MRKHVKEIGKFFVFVAIFFALTSPFVVLFGPFDNLKRTVVGAILKSPRRYTSASCGGARTGRLFAGRNRQDPGRHQLDAETGIV